MYIGSKQLKNGIHGVIVRSYCCLRDNARNATVRPIPQRSRVPTKREKVNSKVILVVLLVHISQRNQHCGVKSERK